MRGVSRETGFALSFVPVRPRGAWGRSSYVVGGPVSTLRGGMSLEEARSRLPYYARRGGEERGGRAPGRRRDFLCVAPRLLEFLPSELLGGGRLGTRRVGRGT